MHSDSQLVHENYPIRSTIREDDTFVFADSSSLIVRSFDRFTIVLAIQLAQTLWYIFSDFTSDRIRLVDLLGIRIERFKIYFKMSWTRWEINIIESWTCGNKLLSGKF